MVKYDGVVCKDGFSMSVQATSCCYAYLECAPGVDIGGKYDYTGFNDFHIPDAEVRKWKWSAVEVGFPSEKEVLLMDYIDYLEDTNDPTKSIYLWVPVEVVSKVIEKHGGLKSGEVPNGVKIVSLNEKGKV